MRRDDSDQTITYRGVGHAYGAYELYRAWAGEKNVSFKVSITALGYVDILQVPATYLEKYVFPQQKFRHSLEKKKSVPLKPERQLANFFNQSKADKTLLEWTVQERFINGTQAMLINLDRCVRCDDCVNACAAAHDGTPRFIRHGKTFGNWMVANACMHCMDPVCMIGCPTGAITRVVADGTVVINDNTCIGCETCANSCPYSNIQMVAINDEMGILFSIAKPTNPSRKRPNAIYALIKWEGLPVFRLVRREPCIAWIFITCGPKGLWIDR